MLLKRYCGHLEKIAVPGSAEKFLMESGRQCRKCRENGNRGVREGKGRFIEKRKG